MKQSGFAIAFAVLMLSACGNKSEQEPAVVSTPPMPTEQNTQVAVEQPVPPAIMDKTPETTGQEVTADKSSVSAKVSEKAEPAPMAPKPAVPAKMGKPSQPNEPEEKTAVGSGAVKSVVPEKAEIPVKGNDGGKGGALNREEGLALANKSGCLACHRIDTKLVGPAWRDVSKRYQGAPDAKAQLIAKVKAGGKGNWTEVTGGIAMPPYSPRVSAEDIEKLVMFILSQ